MTVSFQSINQSSITLKPFLIDNYHTSKVGPAQISLPPTDGAQESEGIWRWQILLQQKVNQYVLTDELHACISQLQNVANMLGNYCGHVSVW